MSEREEMAALLGTARDELRQRLMPGLAGEDRYLAAMIANCMAIAARMLERGEETTEAERRALAGLYGSEIGELPLEALRRRLARDIRRGLFDGEPEVRLKQALEVRIRARLAIADPARLRAPGGETSGRGAIAP